MCPSPVSFVHLCPWPAVPAHRRSCLPATDTATSIGVAMTWAGGAGPWQPALVRRGYDPRSEAAAWRLQVLPCKLPDKWCAPSPQPTG